MRNLLSARNLVAGGLFVAGVVLACASGVATAAIWVDSKCTYGNYPPQCMCPVPNPVPQDRCAAGVPKDGESCAYNTECSPNNGTNCVYSENSANYCGNVWYCPDVDCTEWCPGADHRCVQYSPEEKPPCRGTWGDCPLGDASW